MSKDSPHRLWTQMRIVVGMEMLAPPLFLAQSAPNCMGRGVFHFTCNTSSHKTITNHRWQRAIWQNGWEWTCHGFSGYCLVFAHLDGTSWSSILLPSEGLRRGRKRDNVATQGKRRNSPHTARAKLRPHIPILWGPFHDCWSVWCLKKRLKFSNQIVLSISV